MKGHPEECGRRCLQTHEIQATCLPQERPVRLMCQRLPDVNLQAEWGPFTPGLVFLLFNVLLGVAGESCTGRRDEVPIRLPHRRRQKAATQVMAMALVRSCQRRVARLAATVKAAVPMTRPGGLRARIQGAVPSDDHQARGGRRRRPRPRRFRS